MNSAEPLSTGHLLDGRYRIGKVIGVGGMGRVYLANDTRLANRPVAVKEMMVGEGLQEKKAVEDFAREARVLAPLSHPGIPNLIDYFAERSRHYLVMEYIAGGDLQRWLDQHGASVRVPEPQVLQWGRQLLDVLAFLHAQTPPIVYRDLKPGNIMIDQHSRAMLIDFGIARFLPPGGRGTQIGSVGYAPPEQYLGKLEARSDLYSLGATMHHLLTGRDPQLQPPFSFPPVRQLAPEISAQTEKVVMWSLERDPDRRPRSAKAMLDALPAGSGEDALAPAAGIAPKPGAVSISVMRTKVLSKPAASSQAAGAARTPAAVSARSVSPTAKTADLKGKQKPAQSVKRSVAPPVSARSLDAVLKPSQLPSRPRSGQREAKVGVVSATVGSRVSAPVLAAITGGRAAVTNQHNGAGTVSVPEAGLVCKNQALRFALSAAKVTIGRHSGPADNVDIDLGILKTGGDRVSRRHAEIIKRGEEYFIRDLGSLNGTFILGQGRLGRDQLYKLKGGDQVVIGGATFEFLTGGFKTED